MKLEGTPDEVLALLANLADRVTHPGPRPDDRGTVAARVLERAERDAANARADAAEARLEEAEAELDTLRNHGIGRWPDEHEVDLDVFVPPDWIRAWCATHPLEPATPAAAEPGGVEPLRPDEPETPLPEILVRLKTPAERAEYDERTRQLPTERVRELAGARAATRAPMPRAVGDPGANEGDGLDVWRVDGRALYQQARSAALSRGATPDEAKAVSAYTPADYARLAAAVETLRAAGESKPLATLAARFGRSGPGGLEHALKRAVDLGVMGGGEAPEPGKKGGSVPHSLTEYGRSLLTSNPDDPESDDPDGDVLDEHPELLDLAATTPTPEQQDAIDKLNAEGRAIVERLKNGPRPDRAQLPDRVRRVGASSIPKELRRAYRVAIRNGWSVGKGGSGHLEWYGPAGQKVRTSATIGDVMGAKYAIKELADAGVRP